MGNINASSEKNDSDNERIGCGDQREGDVYKESSQAEPKKSHKRWIVLACLLLVAAALVAVLSFCSDDWYDDDATYISFEGMTEEEINDELNRRVKEGMMNIQIASVIMFENGSAEGAARIKNTEANNRDMKVVITIEETGEVVYESGAIGPGQGIENIKLMTELPEGTYRARAVFTGYNLDTHEEMGSAGAIVELQVLS